MNPAKPANPAETYEQYFVPAMFRPWSEGLLRHAALHAGQNVLDVACGTGIVARHAAALVGAGGSVVAVDMNAAMLAVGSAVPTATGPPIEWRVGNAMDLPCADGAFDAVLCQHGLPFFPDRALAAREMHRVLSPHGQVTTMVLQSLEQHPVFEALMQSVARQLALSLSTVATPFSLSGPGELEALFTAAGFGRVEIAAASIVARFAQPERFVPMAVMSSAAAVPAFARLEAPERGDVLAQVVKETQRVVDAYREGDFIAFPMHANVAVARR